MPYKNDAGHDYCAIFGYSKPEDFDGYEWPVDIKAEIDALIKEHYEPYTSERPEGWILAKFKQAAEERDGFKRRELLDRAKNDAFMQYWKFKPKESKPMPEEVKELLKELNESKRASKPAKPKPPKKEKLPVFRDPAKQAELCNKYPWALPGSFVKDPDKATGTLVSIKCTVCTSSRQIHLSDLFQVKRCLKCKV